MSNYLSEADKRMLRSKVFLAAAKLFLERGYAHTTTRGLAERAGVNVSAMNRQFGSKENILCELVGFVLDGQLRAAQRILDNQTEDAVLYYAVETALQLYMAESSESVRELYLTAYSLPQSSRCIHTVVSETLLPKVFGKYLPGTSPEDYYQMEIASGGVIRGYIGVPCSPAFTIEQKTARFLEASLRIYHVPEDEIRRAIAFVRQFDLKTIARDTIDSMLRVLENPDDPSFPLFRMDQTDPQKLPKRNHSPKEEYI